MTMKRTSLFLAGVTAAFSMQIAHAQPVDPLQEQIRAAERFVQAALGEDCEMNSRTDIPLNSAEPEDVSHFVYDIRYRVSYQPAEEADKQVALFQMFCGMGAYNQQHAFLLRDPETSRFRLLSFARPKLGLDYADEEQTTLKAPPRIDGYSANHLLVNATFDPESKTISSSGFWRGIGDAWDSGAWTFSDLDFVLSRYEVDPTYDGATQPDNQKSYVVYPPG